MPTLAIRAGRYAGRTLQVKPGSFEIGRGEGCQLRDPSPGLSRRHCRVEVTEAGVAVDDLGSRNGTFVNETRIDRLTPLRVGDVVRAGALVFEVIATPEDEQTGPLPAVAGPEQQEIPTVSDVGRRPQAETDDPPTSVPSPGEFDGDPAERAAEIIREHHARR